MPTPSVIMRDSSATRRSRNKQWLYPQRELGITKDPKAPWHSYWELYNRKLCIPRCVALDKKNSLSGGWGSRCFHAIWHVYYLRSVCFSSHPQRIKTVTITATTDIKTATIKSCCPIHGWWLFSLSTTYSCLFLLFHYVSYVVFLLFFNSFIEKK